MLAITGKPLIKDAVKAWKFGPVIESVYHEFKPYGSATISQLGTELISSDDKNIFNMKMVIPKINQDDEEAKAIINAVLKVYGNKSAMYLSNLTHEKGSAWDVTNSLHHNGSVKDVVISNEVIERTMRNKLELND